MFGQRIELELRDTGGFLGKSEPGWQQCYSLHGNLRTMCKSLFTNLSLTLQSRQYFEKFVKFVKLVNQEALWATYLTRVLGALEQ